VKPISLTLLTERLNAALRKAGGGKVLRKRGPLIGTANSAAIGGPDHAGLHRLIYFSRFSSAMPRDGGAQSDEINKIMAAAVRNNAALDVTGLLLIHHGCFIQALEGTSTSVRTIYDRIRPDPRHQSVTIIHMGAATDRKFPGWRMRARYLDQADSAIFATLDLKGAFDPAVLTPSTSLNLLITISDIQAGRFRNAAPMAT
jgi:hypothetical protein